MCYNGSMERIDVLKGIEKILVEKAYETGHISHRADGDWQKQADGSWTSYTRQSDQNSKRYDARTRFGGGGTLLTQDQVMELQQIDDINERKKRQEEMLAENKKDSDSSYEKMKYGEITEEDLEETPKFDSDNEEKNFLKEEYNIDPATYKDSDVQAIRHDLSTTYGLSGDELEYVADLVVNNLPEDDEPSDDEIYDYEDDLMDQREAFRDYCRSHPYPALDNEGHSKGLTSERDMFFDAIERFQQLTDPDEDEQLTPSEALKQMEKEMEMGKDNPEIFTPAIKSGFEKFFNWASDFVGKSAVRDMRSTPVVKNMGF